MTNKLWIIRNKADGLSQAESRYKRILEEKGFRPSTIQSYVFHLRRYLRFVNTDRPSEEDLERFRDDLSIRKVSKSTHNNYRSAIKIYHEMMGEKVNIPFMPRQDTIPYFFSEDEIDRFFGVIHNFKHLLIYQVLYCACLRASELCNLDDCDADLQTLTVYVRDGKGGKDGVTFITQDVAQNLRHYLSIRPPLIIDGRQPLFYIPLLKDDNSDVRMFAGRAL